MKKILCLVLLSAVLLSVCACSKNANINIAVLFTQSGSTNNSYDKSILSGVTEYADENGLSYGTFIASEDTADEFSALMQQALDSHASLIVCAGAVWADEIEAVQEEYPDISFLLVDGSVKKPATNTHCITFKEEQAGFIAGYAAISEGYKHLGFVGTTEVESVTQYGYGFLQGVNYAAYIMGVNDVIVDFWYSEQTQPSDPLRIKMREWYGNGCQLVFTCSQGVSAASKSFVSAANEYKRYLIGAESDKAGESERYITSAVKNFTQATKNAVKAFFDYERSWDLSRSAKTALLGIEQDMVGLPTSIGSFRFKTFSLASYEDICNKIKDGNVLVSSATVMLPQVDYITVNIRYDVLEFPEESSQSN